MMNNIKREQNSLGINIAFVIYFSVLFMLALCPPLYLSVSGSTALIMGIPLPIAYWLAIAILLGLGLGMKYLTEHTFNNKTLESEKSA